jgi:uncharacterized membrane protein YdbT with pleckstrin-like domain
MPQTFDGQHEDEEIDLVFRQHPVVMRRYMIFGLGIFALSTVPLLFWPTQVWPLWVTGGGFLVGLVLFGYRFLGWYFSVYIITSERLIQIRQRGFFDRSVQDISHNRIQSVQYEVKGLQQTLLKFGTISVQTFAGPAISMSYIHKPEEVHQHLNTVIRNIEPEEQLDVPEKGSNERTTEAVEKAAEARESTPRE